MMSPEETRQMMKEAEPSLHNGMRVYTSWVLPATVRRSWQDRLFTWPWKPWISRLPFFVLVDEGRGLCCNPNSVPILERALQKGSLV